MKAPLTALEESSLFHDARVLVVDDVAANVTLLERILRSANVGAIAGLTDPREVVEFCRTWQPDLILLDLHMPYIGGVELLRAMRDGLPKDRFIPTLVLTSDTTSSSKQEALAAGAMDFVTKPFDRLEVLLRARNLLQTRSLFCLVQEQNHRLQADLDIRTAEEQNRADDYRLRSERIASALDAQSLKAVFQPIYDISTDAVVGFEALARFPTSPPRSPDVWFAEAESVGLGLRLELLAVDCALEQLERIDGGCFLSINVSANTAVTDELHDRLGSTRCEGVVVELTEHLHIDDYETLAHGLERLRRQGVRIAVDDAGSGYAGLQQILRLQPDVIKLDLDLTQGISEDKARRAMVAAMVGLSRDLEATLVAEGVETQPDLDALRELGVCWGQGYLLGRPGQLPERLYT